MPVTRPSNRERRISQAELYEGDDSMNEEEYEGEQEEEEGDNYLPNASSSHQVLNFQHNSQQHSHHDHSHSHSHIHSPAIQDDEDDDSFDDFDPPETASNGKNKKKKYATKRSKVGKNGEKPFVCDLIVCGKAFARRSDLVRHCRIHTNERLVFFFYAKGDFVDLQLMKFNSLLSCRPFVCPYPECLKAFIQRSALTVHVRVQFVGFLFYFIESDTG